MANQLYVHPETDGSRLGLALMRRATVVHDKAGNDITSTNPFPVSDIIANSLVPSAYDYISLAYTGTNYLSTVIFKSGGASGTVITTLVLAYDGSNNLTSVAKA
jgi:hypothetical protein